MAVGAVCPINGCLPPDAGSGVTVATEQDAVVTASTVIGSAVGTTVIVTTGANFTIGDYIRVRTERMLITGKASNTLTVTRNVKGDGAVSNIVIGDFVVAGFDKNGDPPHCPACGAAMIIADPAVLNTKTSIATGSLHPVDYDAVYVTNVADANNTQRGTVYAQGATSVTQHGFATATGKVLRGTQVVDINTTAGQVTANQLTPETLNTVAGP